VAGEATIKDLAFLTPLEATRRYGTRLLLSKDELSAYTDRQPNRNPDRPMLFLDVGNIEKYSDSVVYPRNVGMEGEYVLKDTYEAIQTVS